MHTRRPPPHPTQILESNPELRSVISNPQILRETMQMLSNPVG